MPVRQTLSYLEESKAAQPEVMLTSEGNQEAANPNIHTQGEEEYQDLEE